MRIFPRLLDLVLPAAALGLAIFWLTTRTHLGPGIWVAVIVYAISHLLRVSRLVMFFIFEKPSLANVSATHAWSTWLSAVAPFKLGELTRAWAIMRLARKPAAGLAAYASEKVLDASVLLLAILALTSSGYSDAAIGLLAAVLLTVLLFALAAYLTSRATSTELRQLILVGSSSVRGLHALTLLNTFEAAFSAFRQMMGGRVLLLLLVTIGIWILDFTAFYLIAMNVDPAPGQLAGFIDMFESVLLQSAFSPWHAGYWNVVTLTLATATIPSSIYCLYSSLARRRSRQTSYRIEHRQKRYSGEQA